MTDIVIPNAENDFRVQMVQRTIDEQAKTIAELREHLKWALGQFKEYWCSCDGEHADDCKYAAAVRAAATSRSEMEQEEKHD